MAERDIKTDQCKAKRDVSQLIKIMFYLHGSSVYRSLEVTLSCRNWLCATQHNQSAQDRRANMTGPFALPLPLGSHLSLSIATMLYLDGLQGSSTEVR